jgi:ribosomal protein L6P/L9E
VYVKANEQYLPRQVKVRARNPDEVAVEGIDGGAVVALAEPPRENARERKK